MYPRILYEVKRDTNKSEFQMGNLKVGGGGEVGWGSGEMFLPNFSFSNGNKKAYGEDFKP